MKYKEKLEARKLREEGLSLKEIAQKVGASKGSVSLWVRDVKLTDEQIAVLAEKSCHYKQDGCRWSEINREKRLKYRREGAKRVPKKKDLFLMGCMLYWAEGTKSKNTVGLGNTDLGMLRLFKEFLCSCFNVEKEDIRIRINCYLNNGLTLNEVEQYWIDNLELNRENLTKTVVVKKHPMSRGFKKNKHPYGVCLLRVNKTEVVQQIFGAIEEITGTSYNKGLD